MAFAKCPIIKFSTTVKVFIILSTQPKAPVFYDSRQVNKVKQGEKKQTKTNLSKVEKRIEQWQIALELKP